MLEFRGNEFNNGYLERKTGGAYEGQLIIEGVDLSPIEGVYFQEQGKKYLWLKRKPLLEYDIKELSYRRRPREPRWEAYLQSQNDGKAAYKGECAFLRFKFSVVGIWDDVLGKDKQRLNLYVERLPLNQQTIINGINERNREKYNRK